ncbi:hypothetical protein CONCODRAFT_73912 [Conidiobolus coronatus NRRL 28638]|uniref:Homeobox domain-containing protein n=1 Tax=Conidiobolus coronatus (strain ATCC 28846 / CBS 209.66 / NRRL 28638) TaxID=796925 RepID=A0A137NTN4_CONC2|nr:hypothetical protein CONCODRAFT_73912 [Conidiobolus coronatus NRRL 28638]|eukprot:KXN66081.1 hypothetical protein CONCODRAFT_73912 [Conidiobolus coronatus NRRL 28638]
MAKQHRDRHLIFQAQKQQQKHQQQDTFNYSLSTLYSIYEYLCLHIQSKPPLPHHKRLKSQQLQIIYAALMKNPFPFAEERLYLGEILGISARSILIWFKNKRKKVRSFVQEN